MDKAISFAISSGLLNSISAFFFLQNFDASGLTHRTGLERNVSIKNKTDFEVEWDLKSE